MNANERLDEMKRCIATMESALCNEINADIFAFELEKQTVRDKYKVLVQKEEADNLAKKTRLDGLCKKAEALVNGIDRKIFVKQQKNVNPVPDATASDPDAVLDELKTELDTLEDTVLPAGLRRLADSIYYNLNSKYKQSNVDRILRLYETMQKLNSCNGLDAELIAAKNALATAEAGELSIIDKKIAEMKERRINEYVSSLITKALSI